MVWTNGLRPSRHQGSRHTPTPILCFWSQTRPTSRKPTHADTNSMFLVSDQGDIKEADTCRHQFYVSGLRPGRHQGSRHTLTPILCFWSQTKPTSRKPTHADTNSMFLVSDQADIKEADTRRHQFYVSGLRPSRHQGSRHTLTPSVCFWATTLGQHTGPTHWATILGQHTGPTHWATILGQHTGPTYWANILGQHTGPPHWATILGHHTGPTYWATILGHHTGPTHWATILGQHTGPTYWANILGQHTGPPHWATILGQHTGPPTVCDFNIPR